MKYLIIFFLTGCTVLPKYDFTEVEYCAKVHGVIYCKDKPVINMNPEYSCSIYDDLCEED